MRLLSIKQPQTSASHSLSTTAGLIMKANLLSPFLSIFFLFLIFPTIINAKTKPTTYAKLLNPTTLGLKKEKLTHFRLYWHDIVAGPNATTTQLTKPVNTSTTGFGALVMIDDAMTVGPDLNSKLVGRAQGMYALSAQNDVGLTMIMNFCFMEGKYNGSNISILGMNQVFNQVREMPIIGGSGLFRFARGYVQARTHTLNLTSRDACVEYNVYVLHY